MHNHKKFCTSLPRIYSRCQKNETHRSKKVTQHEGFRDNPRLFPRITSKNQWVSKDYVCLKILKGRGSAEVTGPRRMEKIGNVRTQSYVEEVKESLSIFGLFSFFQTSKIPKRFLSTSLSENFPEYMLVHSVKSNGLSAFHREASSEFWAVASNSNLVKSKYPLLFQKMPVKFFVKLKNWEGRCWKEPTILCRINFSLLPFFEKNRSTTIDFNRARKCGSWTKLYFKVN